MLLSVVSPSPVTAVRTAAHTPRRTPAITCHMVRPAGQPRVTVGTTVICRGNPR